MSNKLLFFFAVVFNNAFGYPIFNSTARYPRNRLPDGSCPTRENVISIEDVQEALACSKFAYNGKRIKIGDIVPGTAYKVTHVYEDYISKEDKIGIRVFIAERGLTTVVAYRGTDGNNQLLEQAIGMIKKFTGVEQEILGEKVKINQFFLNAFKLTFPTLRHRLINQSKRYILTGHSLGGALATLLALFMVDYENGKMWENPRTSLITFGEPRVGNEAFAKLHDRVIQSYKKLRFVVRKDPVPHIPLWPWFVHHSREILLDYDKSWFLSTKNEYWLVCRKMEELFCGNYYTLTPNLDDHDKETYEKYINNPPKIYKDNKRKIHNNFEDAILKSCSKKEKRNVVMRAMETIYN